MSNPLSRLATRLAYGASQLPRIAWYVGHSLALRRLSEEVRRRDGKKAPPGVYADLDWIAKRHNITNRKEQFDTANKVVASIKYSVQAK